MPAANMKELHQLGALEAVQGVAQGDFTVETLTGALIDHIEEMEPDVRAWIFLDRQSALARARVVDQAPSGPLSGLLIGIKDVIDTAEMPTAYGSKAYVGNRPAQDSSVVATSRLSGAMVLGKTVSTEFAGMSPGATRNPHNLAHTPGGSSSGSAAAVAASMVPIALGTQTAGSTIRPGAFCGVVAYKPTFDLIDPTGIKTLARCLDTVGIFARNVADVAFYTSVVGQRAALADAAEPTSPRIGLFRTEGWGSAAPETVAVLGRAVMLLEKRGAVVEEAETPPEFEDLLAVHDRLIDWGMLTGLRYEHQFLRDRISPVTVGMLDNNLKTGSAAAFDAAYRRAQRLRFEIDRLFGDFDVLITPSAIGEAPEGLESTGDAIFNRGWTMLHVPCLTVPAGHGPKGLPLGVQLIARPGDDARLFAIGRFLEAALANA